MKKRNFPLFFIERYKRGSYIKKLKTKYGVSLREKLPENYTEKKTVFNILKAGHTPSEFERSIFFKILKNGFNYNSNVVKRRGAEEVLELLDICSNLDSYNLRIEI